MSRVLSALLFSIAALAVTDCQAQRTRLFQRVSSFQQNNSFQKHSVGATNFVHPDILKQNQFELGRYSSYRNPFVSRILDGPTTPGRRDPFEVNSRYIGGFHQSYFDNIGIPSGDIGLRGNAYRWNTW